MPKTPENFEETLEDGTGAILTPSEIGALPPDVPRRSEGLREIKPLEYKARDSEGNEIICLPEPIGDISPNARLIKKGDPTKHPLTFRGRTKDGKAVLESDDGSSELISPRDLGTGYECAQRIYVERTKDGKEVRLDMEQLLKESSAFYDTHDLKEFSKSLPKEVKLSGAAETRLKEALLEGFDKAMVFASPDIQRERLDKLEKLADGPFRGLPDQEQPLEAHYMYQPETIRNAAMLNRPKKAYLLLYQSGPIPDETKGKTPEQLDPLFAQKKWNGFTLEEYLAVRIKEMESRKNHSFDAYSSGADKSNWTWLLDSRVLDGVVHASWNPKDRQVRVSWHRPLDSGPGLGARPAVVVEIEV